MISTKRSTISTPILVRERMPRREHHEVFSNIYQSSGVEIKAIKYPKTHLQYCDVWIDNIMKNNMSMIIDEIENGFIKTSLPNTGDIVPAAAGTCLSPTPSDWPKGGHP
jgi:hypothetical protein